MSAATCSANATAAKPQPMLHHLERKRSIVLRSGWRMSTSGAATAPLCLNRKARFVPSADSSAQMRPMPTDSETLVTAGPSFERSSSTRALPPSWPYSRDRGPPAWIPSGRPACRPARAQDVRAPAVYPRRHASYQHFASLGKKGARLSHSRPALAASSPAAGRRGARDRRLSGR